MFIHIYQAFEPPERDGEGAGEAGGLREGPQVTVSIPISNKPKAPFYRTILILKVRNISS
jgi:hypothetical protein